MENADLSQLEDKIFRERYQDGRREFVVGSAFALYAAIMLLNLHPAFLVVLLAWVVVAARVWQRRITLPRLGYASLRPEYQRTQTRTAASRILKTLAIVSVATLFTTVWTSFKVAQTSQRMTAEGPAPMPDLSAVKLVIGLAFALTLAGAGYQTKTKPLYYLAASCMAFFAASYFLDLDTDYALLATGLAMMIAGIVEAKKFLRENPKVESDVDGNE